MRGGGFFWSLVTLVLVGAGCRTRPAAGLSGFDCDGKTGICVPRDAGPPADDGSTDGDGSAAGDASDGADGVGVTVAITSPTSPAATNGSIMIQIAFSPPTAAPASADLYDGDSKLATVSSPFAFLWETSAAPAVPEGPHQVIARATVPGGSITSDAVTIIVDRTAPTIMRRAPAAGATNVLFADPIQIVFSEPIDPATLAGGITLSSGAGAIATSAALAADGETVTVTLADRHAVPVPADVTVAVKATIADRAGNQLGVVPTWSWNAPVWVKLPMLAGKLPEIALGPDDRPLVLNAVEQGAVGSNDFVLQLARLGTTRSWDTSVPSPQGARPAARISSRAALALGADGAPVTAWPEAQGSSPSTMHVARWTGTAWDSGYGQLDAVAAAGTSAYNPTLAFSPAGDLFLAWQEPNPSAFGVFTARWSGSAWDTSYGSAGVIGASVPALKFGADGRPVIAVSASTSTGVVARWTGTSWSALPAFTESYASPSLAIDATDRPVVTSVSGQLSDQYVRLYFFNPTTAVWTEEIPAVPTGGQPNDAQLVLPADGHPVVAWSEADTTTGTRVVRVSRHNGAQWDFTYGSLDGVAGTGTDGSAPRMVLDSGGSPIVAWQESDGVVVSTYVWRSNH